jgi:hypothetical protein
MVAFASHAPSTLGRDPRQARGANLLLLGCQAYNAIALVGEQKFSTKAIGCQLHRKAARGTASRSCFARATVYEISADGYRVLGWVSKGCPMSKAPGSLHLPIVWGRIIAYSPYGANVSLPRR